MQQNTRLCIVVPCYNPSEEWGPAFAEKFKEIEATLSPLVDHVSLTLVNDGHILNQRPAVLGHLAQLLPEADIISYEQNRGKGFALRTGVSKADGDLYLMTDADFPYTLESMKAIVLHLIDHGGIAAGNRDLAYYSHVPAFRKWLSKALRWMLKHLLRLQVTDSQCGLKGFDRAGKAVFLETTIDRFLFDLEFLLLAKKRVNVMPVPVQLRPNVVFSRVGGKVLLTEGLNFLKLFFRQIGS